MAKKSKRKATRSAKQSSGTSNYFFEGLVAMARTLVNAKKEWGVEKMNELADATQEYAKSIEDIPTLGRLCQGYGSIPQGFGRLCE